MKNEYRFCEVNKQLCYFHCWEHSATVVAPSLMIGGDPGGQLSCIVGIVETPDGFIKRVPIEDIRFCDEVHCGLAAMEKHLAKKEADTNAN